MLRHCPTPVVFHVPRSKRDVFLVTELLNLSVRREAVHRRQVAAGLFTAFLHVKQDFTRRSYNSLFFLGGTKLVDRGLPIAMQSRSNVQNKINLLRKYTRRRGSDVITELLRRLASMWFFVSFCTTKTECNELFFSLFDVLCSGLLFCYVFIL